MFRGWTILFASQSSMTIGLSRADRMPSAHDSAVPSSLSLGSWAGNHPYWSKSTVRSPMSLRSTWTPSSASADSCRAAPPPPLVIQFVTLVWAEAKVAAEPASTVPVANDSFGVDDALPRHSIAVVARIRLVRSRWKILETHPYLAAARQSGVRRRRHNIPHRGRSAVRIRCQR
jgi:hypothetical protein